MTKPKTIKQLKTEITKMKHQIVADGISLIHFLKGKIERKKIIAYINKYIIENYGKENKTK